MIKINDPERIYLDHNATTPLAESIYDKVPGWMNSWGNPSSIHWAGRGPKNLIRVARKKVADAIVCHPLEVIFTSGGSEANNLALKGLFYKNRFSKKAEQRDQYIVSAVEHPSVMKVMDFLVKEGALVDIVPVNRSGELDMDYFASLLSDRTALVSIMYANNETGNIFPIQKLAKMAHGVGALFHCDAVQALGKAVVDVQKWGVDAASFSGHKFYSLKGAGALYIKKGTMIEPLIHGGAQERSRRAGTENVLAISAFGEVAKEIPSVEHLSGEIRELRDYLESQILSRITDIKITGIEGKRLPNTSSMIVSGVDGETLLMNLDMKGVSVSTGAACSSGSPEPSPVLMAMGLSRGEAQSSLRLSLGWGNDRAEIDRFIDTLEQVVVRLRSFDKEYDDGI